MQRAIELGFEVNGYPVGASMVLGFINTTEEEADEFVSQIKRHVLTNNNTIANFIEEYGDSSKSTRWIINQLRNS